MTDPNDRTNRAKPISETMEPKGDGGDPVAGSGAAPNENNSSASGDSADAVQSFAELILKAKSGDHEAIESLVVQYRPYLLFIANHECSLDPNGKIAASDIVQETMMHAVNKIEQFNDQSESGWKAWIKKILINETLRSHRRLSAQKRNTNREVNLQENSALARALLDDQLTPSSEAMKSEKARIVSLALNQLPEDQRKVIELRNFEQLSLDEISGQMNRSTDAVRKLWARAVEALQQILNQQSPDLVSGNYRAARKDEA